MCNFIKPESLRPLLCGFLNKKCVALKTFHQKECFQGNTLYFICLQP